jgi:hypothetical protein
MVAVTVLLMLIALLSADVPLSEALRASYHRHSKQFSHYITSAEEQTQGISILHSSINSVRYTRSSFHRDSRGTRDWRLDCSRDDDSAASQAPSYIQLDSEALGRTLIRMFIYSAILGPCLDNYHGLFDVLNYREGIPIVVEMGGRIVFKSAAWVPLLFGFAGVVMSYIVLSLDSIFKTAAAQRLPSWPKVFYGISFFSADYYLSGLLDNINADMLTSNIILIALIAVGRILFDTSAPGILLGISTAIAGPVAEIILINTFNLYSYTHADIVGICSWIPWVYFVGGFAVGNLARRVYSDETLRNS